MAGLYIHIPFCKTRCIYCDFFTQTCMQQKDRFIDAVCKELTLRKEYLGGEMLNTIYFGGGTPSQLSENDFNTIFDSIDRHYTIAPDAEITIEANPDDLDKAYISMLRRLPVNRISIGIQSFNDEELAFLNRRHSAQKAKDAVKECRQAGFSNISIDLMYGLPDQTLDSWIYNLNEAVSSGIQHISSYHLIYEEGTKLYRQLQKGNIQPADEELSNEMFLQMRNILKEAGFIHYEISNFAREGYFSRHNSSYWKGEKYLGIGPSAHSYNGTSREWNVSSLGNYIEGIHSGNVKMETEVLDNRLKYNDYILTGLRTMWGIELSRTEKLFGRDMLEYCLSNAQKYITNGLIIKNGDKLTIAEKGLLISDGIMSDLMFID